ncbi:acetate kinase, partial [Cobetia sp. BMC6]|nr:acetate kinase [Cobetia sp. BMC6]
MPKVIAINAGSSSLKFQLFNMPSEEVLTKGVVERIGFEDAIFNITVNGE